MNNRNDRQHNKAKRSPAFNRLERELVFRSLAYSMSAGDSVCEKAARRRGKNAMEISLCMIVRDEEASLPRCLESIKGAVDEIIIVDTGSKDRTKEIARQYTENVYDYQWQDDFADARNVSLSYATKPFILWLDADDVMDRSEREKLIALKSRLDESVDVVMMPYRTGAGLVFERERIVRRAAGFVFMGVVHEAMEISGNVIHEDIVVCHERGNKKPSGRRNLEIYEKWQARGRRMSPRDQYYYARELMDCGETARAEQAFALFLMGDGWIENRIDAYVQRGVCLQKLNRPLEAKQSILSALALTAPRAEALCAMGNLAMSAEDWENAVFWYRAAMIARPPENTGAFVFLDAYRYIPAIQLCVCYDHLGNTRLASQMNEQALLARPGDPAALQNRVYFEGKLAQQGERLSR